MNYAYSDDVSQEARDYVSQVPLVNSFHPATSQSVAEMVAYAFMAGVESQHPVPENSNSVFGKMADYDVQTLECTCTIDTPQNAYSPGCPRHTEAFRRMTESFKDARLTKDLPFGMQEN